MLMRIFGQRRARKMISANASKERKLFELKSRMKVSCNENKP